MGVCTKLFLQAKHRRQLKPACSIALGRVSVHHLQAQVSLLLEKTNRIEYSEVLLPFSCPWELITDLCPLLCVLQGEITSQFPLLPFLSMGAWDACPLPEAINSPMSSWAFASSRNAITITFTDFLRDVDWGILKYSLKHFTPFVVPVVLLSIQARSSKRWVYFNSLLLFVCGAKLDLCAATGL